MGKEMTFSEGECYFSKNLQSYSIHPRQLYITIILSLWLLYNIFSQFPPSPTVHSIFLA